MYHLITRPLIDATLLETRLAANKIMLFSEALLITSTINKAKDQLQSLLSNESQFIILTSANAVRSMAELSPIRSLQLITVGDKTAQIAKDCGFLNVISTSGNASTLINYIKKNIEPKHANLLYLTAPNQAANFEEALYDYNLQSLIIYEAKAASSLSQALIDIIKKNQLSSILFFSKRTAQIFLELSKKYNIIEFMSNIKALALSINIAQLLESVQWRQILISECYTEDAMIKLLMDNI